MIKIIDESNIQDVIGFSWEVCENLISTCYPIRKSKSDLEKSLVQSLRHPDDKVLGYFKNDKLIGAIEIVVEAAEGYLQARPYIIEDFEEVMNMVINYLKEYYPTFKAHIGYPKDNATAINYFITNQYQCIEASNDLRLSVEDLVYNSNKISNIQRLTKDNFTRYATFHDKHGGEQMYWNSTRLYDAFDSWYIYLYNDISGIVGSILTCKARQGIIEIFGLFIEDVANKHDIVEDLLYNSILKIMNKEKDVRQVIFFIDEKELVQYEVAKRIGFKETGNYCCYSIDL